MLSFQDSFVVVLCGGDKPGIVLDLSLEDPDPAAAYPNITAFMQEIAEYFQTGAYYINDEGDLVIDVKQEQMIFRKYHPALDSRYAVNIEIGTETRPNPDGSKIVTNTYANGIIELKHFNSRGLLVKEESQRGGRFLSTTTHRYNDEGKIRERVYITIDVHKTKWQTNVAWDYKPNGRVFITIRGRNSGLVKVIEAVHDSDGNWRVIKIENMKKNGER
jgi:hypothetical protein